MKNAYIPEEPIAAIATALAPSALGIVRVSGKNCLELVSHIFSRPKALLEAHGNTIVYGWIVNPEEKQNGKSKKIDEVLISVFKSPKSFTGEDMAEISCHGGTAVVSSIYNLLLKNGFREAQRGEYTFRSYINGKADLTKAEAVREIIEGKTKNSCGRAAGRLAGSLYEQIESIKKLIMDTIAAIEVSIEYPEDEETIADSFDHENLIRAKNMLYELYSSWKSEKLYQDGARVVLCGKTNVGKSSLFNALLKEERAIVSDIEGTTRDWIESWVSFDGVPARLFDTAGLRSTSDKIEQKGVERTRDISKDADLVLYLADISNKAFEDGTVCEDDLKEFSTFKNIPVVFVWNKCDNLKGGLEYSSKKNNDSHSEKDFCKSSSVLPDLPLPHLNEKIAEKIPLLKEQIHISAKTGKGIENLAKKVKEILIGNSTTEREQAGLGSARQEKAVKEAYECVVHALQSADEDFSLDAAVQDLENSLDALAEVTGEVTPDDILETIFANFCVGK